jgi:hypothetical protein
MLGAAVLLTYFTGGATSFSARFAGFVASQAACIAAAAVVNFELSLLTNALVCELLAGLPLFDRIQSRCYPCYAVGERFHGHRNYSILPS